MGSVPSIGFDKFPKQGPLLHSLVRVSFNFDFDRCIAGTVVRDDAEEPWLTIISLDDGRVVLGTECQYTNFSD